MRIWTKKIKVRGNDGKFVRRKGGMENVQVNLQTALCSITTGMAALKNGNELQGNVITLLSQLLVNVCEC